MTEIKAVYKTGRGVVEAEPCPFCGHRPLIFSQEIPELPFDLVTAMCEHPGCAIERLHIPLKKWNERAGKHER